MYFSQQHRSQKVSATRSSEYQKWESQGRNDALKESLQMLDGLPDSTPVEVAQQKLKALMNQQGSILARQENAPRTSTSNPMSRPIETEEARENRIGALLNRIYGGEPLEQTQQERDDRIAAELTKFGR